MEETIWIRVTGIVQGVNFRRFTREEARRLGLRGTVQNLEDGSVEIRATGNQESLRQFLHWCYTGPDHARVHSGTWEHHAYQDFTDFQIKY
jgi:acylphosphatase